MHKKIITFFIFTTILSSPIHAIYFTDIVEFPDWATEAIENVEEEKIMTGFGDGSFRPWKELNRAEAVTLLLRIKNISAEEVVPHNFFEDVSGTDWFTKAVTVASEKGWVLGKSQNMFYPADRINRAEFATIIMRAFDLNTQEFENIIEYRDIPSNAWYTPAVYAMYDNSLIRSPNSLFYYPNKNITRAEAAWTFSRILNMPRLNGTSQENDFSDSIKRDARKIAIRPRDFNKYKQGYDIEKKEVRVSVEENAEFIDMTKQTDWTDLGSLTIENALDDRFELNTLRFKLRFRETSVGPAGNFFAKITNKDESLVLEQKVARTGEIAFTGLEEYLESADSMIFTLSIKPDSDENFYKRSGEGTFTIIDAQGVYWSTSTKDSSTSNTLAKFAPIKFNSREFSRIKFTP